MRDELLDYLELYNRKGGMMTQKGEGKAAITADDVPKQVADEIVRRRVLAATGPNLGRAANAAEAYYVDGADRAPADTALLDALNVNQDTEYVASVAEAIA